MTTETRQAGQAVDDEFVLEFMTGWQAAWNSHDPERVVAKMTADCTYDDAGWHKTMRGHDDVREFLRSTWRAMPDMEFYWARFGRIPGEAAAMAHWKLRATMLGKLEPPGYAATLGPVEFDGFDYHEYRDGKIARLRIIFNMADIGRQIGAMPPAGSKREKAIVLLQSAQARFMRRGNAKR